ncbi:hypothetical protein EJ03DRAFT_50938 [Teratosphaeria nubilosa]|uniref:Uncharacterized protein n=1 Tax=Teratosphaeria nubilosa TaxID=161662 RepID=A0A6G1LDB6_9PEZI|nr:hypothetical protein EJ03DRAFT_50938 [Teratosphaeria nubilosa]
MSFGGMLDMDWIKFMARGIHGTCRPRAHPHTLDLVQLDPLGIASLLHLRRRAPRNPPQFPSRSSARPRRVCQGQIPELIVLVHRKCPSIARANGGAMRTAARFAPRIRLCQYCRSVTREMSSLTRPLHGFHDDSGLHVATALGLE